MVIGILTVLMSIILYTFIVITMPAKIIFIVAGIGVMVVVSMIMGAWVSSIKKDMK